MVSKPRRILRNPGRGSLLLIMTFLIGSALIRVGTEAGQAFAKETPVDESESTVSPVETESPDFEAILAAFKEREDRILQRESELRSRARALDVVHEEVDFKIKQLQAAEERLGRLIAVAETAAEDDLTRLTSVYETMKPKEAAALFEQMDPEFAAGFLARMQPEAAAGVLAGLSPEAAYTISVILAGRNARAPKE